MKVGLFMTVEGLLYAPGPGTTSVGVKPLSLSPIVQFGFFYFYILLSWEYVPLPGVGVFVAFNYGFSLIEYFTDLSFYSWE